VRVERLQQEAQVEAIVVHLHPLQVRECDLLVELVQAVAQVALIMIYGVNVLIQHQIHQNQCIWP
tara:strand:- start:208 stop:402 length:195 start_codon:yes stop_codon:yes gene_type:complete